MPLASTQKTVRYVEWRPTFEELEVLIKKYMEDGGKEKKEFYFTGQIQVQLNEQVILIPMMQPCAVIK